MGSATDWLDQEYHLNLVDNEMIDQAERWGVQDHPLIGGTMPSTQRGWCAGEATKYKRLNDSRVKADNLGWDTILLEEVFEALEAKTPKDQHEELLQVAAVAVNAAMSVRRNAA